MIIPIDKNSNEKYIDLILLEELKEKTTYKERKEEIISLAYIKDSDFMGGIVGEVTFHSCYVSLLGVKKEFQGRGIGKILLQALEKACREKELKKIHLTTQDYQAKDFYVKQNYQVAGQLIDVPFEGTTRYILVKDLADEDVF